MADDKNRIKLMLVGETDVGKTSIFERFLHNQFTEKINSSVGFDYESKQFKYKKNVYNIDLYDTAGQERFRSILREFLKRLKEFSSYLT